MNKPKFKFLHKEESYDVEFNGKNYTLFFDWDENIFYGSFRLYDEEGNEILASEDKEIIINSFSQLK